MEEEIRVANEGKAKAITSKAIKDFQASIEFLAKKANVATKVVEDFQASMEFKNEKIDFVVATYKETIKRAKDKVAARWPGVDLGFLDEFLVPKEGSAMINTPNGATTPTTTP